MFATLFLALNSTPKKILNYFSHLDENSIGRVLLFAALRHPWNKTSNQKVRKSSNQKFGKVRKNFESKVRKSKNSKNNFLLSTAEELKIWKEQKSIFKYFVLPK